MLKYAGLAAVLVLGTSVSAMAATCSRPVPPDMSNLDGTTATTAQMKNAISDFKTYQSAADDYEACLQADLNAQKQAAANAKDPKPLDPSIISATNSKVADVQAEKEKLGGELNAQIHAYQNAHKK